ncbi:MAG: hypothetical protein KUG78_06445 [Kangiellaceae bacterium]|nr:hypothetical protein [Kangiellaceae bacterium]
MKFKTILTSTIIFTLAGCTIDSSTVSPLPEKDSQSGPIGKPSAPISMSYKILTENPKAGDEIEIQVTFSSTVSSAISTSMKSAKKLTWLNSKTNWESTLSKSGERSRIPSLKVSAEEDGIYYVHLMASVVEQGNTLFKPFTILVNVGSVEPILESAGEIVVDEKGQKIIIQDGDSNN